MSFDATGLAVPTLADVSHLLRHPEAQPPEFRWHFGTCATCAIGLAAAVFFPGRRCAIANLRMFVRKLSLDYAIVNQLFGYALAKRLGLRMDQVTPLHVADAIDEYLAHERHRVGER